MRDCLVKTQHHSFYFHRVDTAQFRQKVFKQNILLSLSRFSFQCRCLSVFPADGCARLSGGGEGEQVCLKWIFCILTSRHILHLATSLTLQLILDWVRALNSCSLQEYIQSTMRAWCVFDIVFWPFDSVSLFSYGSGNALAPEGSVRNNAYGTIKGLGAMISIVVQSTCTSVSSGIDMMLGSHASLLMYNASTNIRIWTLRLKVSIWGKCANVQMPGQLINQPTQQIWILNQVNL